MSSPNMSCKEMSRRAAMRGERKKENMRRETPGKRSRVARFRNVAKPPNARSQWPNVSPVLLTRTETAFVIVKGDALDQAGDFLGCGCALRLWRSSAIYFPMDATGTEIQNHAASGRSPARE